jgi:hypothetical protein
MNWPGDVLDGMLAQIRKANRQFLGDMLAHCRADASLAGLGKGFETRRDIDTVTEDIVTLDDHIAHVDPDAKTDAATFIDICVAALHPLLHHHGAPYRIDDRCELPEETVTNGFDERP